MAVLDVTKYRLNIDNTKVSPVKTYQCKLYSTVAEAKPVSYQGTAIAGEVWEVKQTISGTTGTYYIGLMPKTSTTYTTYNTPLVIKKSNVEYYAVTQTYNSYSVTIKATSNQKITFTAEGTTTEVTTADKTVYVTKGAGYTCSVTSNTGYTKGTLSGASASGTVDANMTVSASAATINSYVMTVSVPTGATIKVGDVTYSAGTSTVTFNYATQVKITYSPTNAAQYSISNTKANGAAFTSGNTFTMPAGACTVTCDATVRKYTVTIAQATGTTLSVTANDKAVSSGDSFNYGTVLTYSVSDSDSTDAYESPTASAGGV